MLNDIHSQAISRRSFMVTTGAFSIAVAFGSAPDTASAAAPFTPNAWVTIGGDDIVTIVAPMVEMGQGVRTSLPLILAEDLDADWSKVRVSETPDDASVYGNPIFNNQLSTVGSFSVTGYYEKLRLAGAQARKILLANAAATWNVPANELTTEPGMVVHAQSKRKISYGDIAKTATVPNPLPEVTKADLKPSSQFRLIGHDTGRLDVPSKVNGTAQYGIDMQLPGMLYAAVLYPQVQYEKPEQVDDAAAKAVKGVVKVVPLPSGVGVIAETIDAAMKAKNLLKVTWSKTTPAQTYDDDRVVQDYRAIAADWTQPGVEMLNAGDADGAIKGAARVLSADYLSDHVSHVCMEPLNATVKVDGDRIDIWSGNQSPGTMKILGMIVGKTTPDKVHVHTQLLGGGFGRRSDGDDMVQALILALNVPGKPVKMIWNREDDIRNDKLRPLTAQRIEIGLDADNNIVGWRQRIVNESYFARVLPRRGSGNHGTGWGSACAGRAGVLDQGQLRSRSPAPGHAGQAAREKRGDLLWHRKLGRRTVWRAGSSGRGGDREEQLQRLRRHRPRGAVAPPRHSHAGLRRRPDQCLRRDQPARCGVPRVLRRAGARLRRLPHLAATRGDAEERRVSVRRRARPNRHCRGVVFRPGDGMIGTCY